VTSIMPQLISAFRKFAKIDAGDSFCWIRTPRTRPVYSLGTSAGIALGQQEWGHHDQRGFMPPRQTLTLGGICLYNNFSQRSCCRGNLRQT
jgi:hypothetical protein